MRWPYFAANALCDQCYLWVSTCIKGSLLVTAGDLGLRPRRTSGSAVGGIEEALSLLVSTITKPLSCKEMDISTCGLTGAGTETGMGAASGVWSGAGGVGITSTTSLDAWVSTGTGAKAGSVNELSISSSAILSSTDNGTGAGANSRIGTSSTSAAAGSKANGACSATWDDTISGTGIGSTGPARACTASASCPSGRLSVRSRPRPRRPRRPRRSSCCSTGAPGVGDSKAPVIGAKSDSSDFGGRCSCWRGCRG